MCCRALIFLLLLISNAGLHAQSPEFTRHITRSFKISSGMSVDISNKYGKVQIIPWDTDSVRFSIDLRIRAKDKQKLEKLKQNVDFEFIPGQYYILARTKFSDSGSEVFKEIVDIAGSYLSSSNSVTINYTVMVPSRIPLKIDNKFGDVFFDDLEGPLNLTLSYGDLKANRLNGRTEIKLTSGDAEINYLRDAQLFISYGNLHLHEAGKLIAQTRSSIINIDKAGSLSIDSRRDKVYLGETGSLDGSTYFSNINVSALQNDMSLVSRYGGIILNIVHRSFSRINLTSEFTDLTLAFEKPASFSLNLIHHQDVVFAYPNAIASLKTKVLDAESKLFSTSGTLGAGTPNSETIIKATRKCHVTISQK